MAPQTYKNFKPETSVFGGFSGRVKAQKIILDQAKKLQVCAVKTMQSYNASAEYKDVGNASTIAKARDAQEKAQELIESLKSNKNRGDFDNALINDLQNLEVVLGEFHKTGDAFKTRTQVYMDRTRAICDDLAKSASPPKVKTKVILPRHHSTNQRQNRFSGNRGIRRK